MKLLGKKFLFIILLVVCGCGQKSNDHENHEQINQDSLERTGNEALYDEVMKVHDEVMPKMNDIYTLKQKLNEKLTIAQDLTEEKKKEINSAIATLDSASESMMVWMRKFSPLPDSLGEEKVREYLETEMEEIKKVKEGIRESLEKGNEL